MVGRGAGARGGETDAEKGLFRGRSVARRYESPDGWLVLVGRDAASNDVLTFKLGRPDDFWLHVAADSGSHVLIPMPRGETKPPRETLKFAAALAARHSKARGGGQVDVHVARVRDVSKPRGSKAGLARLRRHDSVRERPLGDQKASASELS